MMSFRTGKVFENYNDYRDRPFGLKWKTAFALDELNKVIDYNKQQENKEVLDLGQMSRQEMDEVLQKAFLKRKKISIQTNLYDEHDRLLDSISGYFTGSADCFNLYFSGKSIPWEYIRNIQIVE